MARILIVGCGCRGRALAGALAERGHAVRGTTRSAGALAEIEAAGAEGVVADPLALGTLTAQLQGVSALCWLMGSAEGAADDVAALHGPRLTSLLGALVETPVRGFVYEGAGTVDARLLDQGARLALGASETHRMPVRVLEADPADVDGWVAGAMASVEEVLR